MSVISVRSADRYCCSACHQNRALYITRTGRIKARKDHPLCQRCYQSELDRQRASTLLPREVELRWAA